MNSVSKNDIVIEICTVLPDFVRPSDLSAEELFEAFAQELVERICNQKISGFENVFAKLEHHIIWNEPDLRQWLIINFLEVLKNVATWSDVDYILFEQWLGPETHVAWRWLEKRWRGNQSLADTVKYGTKRKNNS